MAGAVSQNDTTHVPQTAAQHDTVSVVVPVWNEQNSIPVFLDELERVVRECSEKFDLEIVFVNDGSTDATEMAVATEADARAIPIRLVNLSRNFGKDAALAAGLAAAQGAAVVPMDVDLQDDPSVLPDMVQKWRAGAQVVNARRVDRSADGFVKRTTSGAFYKVFNALADHPIPENVGDFRLLDRQVVDVLTQIGERARFNKALFSWVGFRTEEVTFERAERKAGTTKWNWWKLWNFALDGIFTSSTKPLRIWSYCGLIMASLAFLYAGFILLYTLVMGRETPGFATTIILILFFGGVNLIALGIIGEYVGRIYAEVRARPLYVIRSIVERDD